VKFFRHDVGLSTSSTGRPVWTGGEKGSCMFTRYADPFQNCKGAVPASRADRLRPAMGRLFRPDLNVRVAGKRCRVYGWF
jgi:hypothetical protein